MKACLNRTIAAAGMAAVLLSGAWMPAHAEDGEWHTSSALIGASKYGDDFKQYDYVNPNAPKGGTLNTTTSGTFDSFNPYIVPGNPAAGFAGFGGGLLYDTLMEQSVDEGSVSHPLVADAYKFPADFSSATYRLDPRAKWHDGQPITVDDVIWSFKTLKANSPLYNKYYANVTEAVATVQGTAPDSGPWNFAGDSETSSRLRAAGFEPLSVRLRPDPFRCEDPVVLEEYLATVVLGAHLDPLLAAEHASFVREVRLALPEPCVDYVRLEIDAVRR